MKPLEPDVDRPKKRPRVLRYLLLAALVFGGVAASGILSRNHSDAELAKWTDQQAIPTVDVVTPKKATENQALTLPADVQAFYTAPIHARVNGYVKMWYFDIGAKVHAGDVLARIDTPDLDQQYEQAKGELAKAQADYNLAVLTADRWKSLRASQAVSQQTADEKTGDALARKAQVAAAQASVDRLRAMEGFKDITVPFDGTVTARHIDVGGLVSATDSNQPALYDIASTKRMRVYMRVPQVYTASIKDGMSVTLKLPQYPGRTFKGTVDTTSNAISDLARALLVEAIFPNEEGLLSPGSYAQARFELPLDPHKLVVPASAMIFRGNHPEVATVEGDKVVLKQVSILMDTGNEIELSSGVSLDDKVIVSPSDSIADGDEVKIGRVDGKTGDKKVAAQTPGPRHEASE